MSAATVVGTPAEVGMVLASQRTYNILIGPELAQDRTPERRVWHSDGSVRVRLVRVNGPRMTVTWQLWTAAQGSEQA